MNNSRATVEKWVTAGVLAALVMAMGVTGIDFIPLPFASITFLHVPVIIGALLEGPAVGAFVGLLFGISSIIRAGMIGTTPIDLAFLHYPVIAILPRLLIGPAAYLVYRAIAGKGAKNIGETVYTPKKVFRESAAIVLGAVAGTLTNTVLVLGGLVIFIKEVTVPMALLAAPNGLLEAAAAAIVSLAVVSAWKHIPRHGGRAKLRDLET